MANSPLRRILLVAGIAGWLVGLSAGLRSLWLFAYTPGEAAVASTVWPGLRVSRDTERPTLVVALHPDCACSNATLGELARLMVRAPRVSVTALFVVPAGQTVPTANSNWRTALSIPGVNAVVDSAGIEARRFGARVSGQTFLYDAEGWLVFSGGITPSRGHAGDNDGEDAVVAFLTSGTSPINHTPVFGCALESEAQK